MKKWLAALLLMCLCITAFAESFQKGDSGDGVTRLQRRLVYLGYLDEADVDGRYGSHTETAVARYQARHQMEATGRADEETYEAIMGTGVRAAQERLIALGYLGGEADGVFGQDTERAIRRFQADHALVVTGQLDEATLEALEAAENDAPVQEQAEAEVMDEEIVPDDRPEEEQIREAQESLILLGYLDGKADGIAGHKTRAAVAAFQKDLGMQPTGELDYATKLALNRKTQGIRDTVRIQKRLIELGYLTGSADGVFGEKSVTAMQWFQRVHGLAVTRTPDEATMEKLFSEDVTALRKGLSQGDEGDAVKELQERLTAMGFYSHGADGKYGKNTQAGVKSFQEHLILQGMDVTATGDATPITQELLFSDSYSTYLRDVEPGVEDAEAERIERRLIYLGYMDEAADRVLDDYAMEALDAFREAAGVKERGRAGRETVDSLFSGNAPATEAYVPHAIRAGSAGKAVLAFRTALQRYGFMTALPSEAYDPATVSAVSDLHGYLSDAEMDEASMFADPEEVSVEAQSLLTGGDLSLYRQDVESGADASEIRRVQTRLYSLYYLEVTGVDGKFGDGTRSALKEFQSQNDLEATGRADRGTQDLLFSAEAAENKRPWRVEISISDQKVYVYQLQEDGSYKRIHAFTCSTGVGDSTPRGIYLDGRPINRWHYFKDFNCWAQYSYEVVGHIMIHSVLYSAPYENTLRKGSVYALGGKASHGCIRLAVPDAKWLFDNCKRGSVIIKIY